MIAGKSSTTYVVAEWPDHHCGDDLVCHCTAQIILNHSDRRLRPRETDWSFGYPIHFYFCTRRSNSFSRGNSRRILVGRADGHTETLLKPENISCQCGANRNTWVGYRKDTTGQPQPNGCRKAFTFRPTEKCLFPISANQLKVDQNVNRAHLKTHWLAVKWRNEPNAPTKWTQIEHCMCGRRATWLPVWLKRWPWSIIWRPFTSDGPRCPPKYSNCYHLNCFDTPVSRMMHGCSRRIPSVSHRTTVRKQALGI